jgi:ASC-1-like (ASCH) protein
MVNYIKNLSEPWFTLISLGLKTCEGRLNKGDFYKMQVGDTITFTNDDFNHREVSVRITKLTKYKTFESYLKKEKLKYCLPGIKTMKDGLSVYFKYFTKEKEAQYGIVAIHMELI